MDAGVHREQSLREVYLLQSFTSDGTPVLGEVPSPGVLRLIKSSNETPLIQKK